MSVSMDSVTKWSSEFLDEVSQLKEENRKLRQANASLQSQLLTLQKQLDRHVRYQHDYLPYPEDDYRR